MPNLMASMQSTEGGKLCVLCILVGMLLCCQSADCNLLLLQVFTLLTSQGLTYEGKEGSVNRTAIKERCERSRT